MAVTDPSEAPEEALIASARDGDARAFDELLRRHEARVFRVLRLLGVPAGDREDVAQDIFLRVFRGLDGFRPGKPFGAWLYRITVNASQDWRGRSARVRAGETPWQDGADEPADPGESPAEAAERRALAQRLEAALGQLTDRERAVFVLKELEGLETEDVARALGVTQITVRRHLGLARDRLRLLLAVEKKLVRD